MTDTLTAVFSNGKLVTISCITMRVNGFGTGLRHGSCGFDGRGLIILLAEETLLNANAASGTSQLGNGLRWRSCGAEFRR